MKEAPSTKGASSRSSDTSHREDTRGGELLTVGSEEKAWANPFSTMASGMEC